VGSSQKTLRHPWCPKLVTGLDLNLVSARPSHVERVSLRLYSLLVLLVDFWSALLRFAQAAYE